MTLKRYQPARKRKRPSKKKRRPLKALLALGVVGVAVGSVYAAMNSHVVIGLLNGSIDFPDPKFGRPANEAAVVAAKMATEKGQAPAGAPKGLALKTASPPALKPKPSPSPTAAPAVAASPVTLAMVSPKPSAFPEGAQAARTVGEVVSVQVIARPHDDIATVLPRFPAAKK